MTEARTDFEKPFDTAPETPAAEHPDIQLDPRDVEHLQPDELDRLVHLQRHAGASDPDVLMAISELAAKGTRRRLEQRARELSNASATAPAVESQAKPSKATPADVAPGKVTVLGVQHGAAVRASLREGKQRYALVDAAVGQLLRAVIYPAEVADFYDHEKPVSSGAYVGSAAVRQWLAELVENHELTAVVIDADVVRYSLRALRQIDQDNPQVVARIAATLQELAASSGVSIVLYEPTRPTAQYVNRAGQTAASGKHFTETRHYSAPVKPVEEPDDDDDPPPPLPGDDLAGVPAAEGLTTTGVV
jgi:hypothetical protein